jgi:hypothetical protein
MSKLYFFRKYNFCLQLEMHNFTILKIEKFISFDGKYPCAENEYLQFVRNLKGLNFLFQKWLNLSSVAGNELGPSVKTNQSFTCCCKWVSVPLCSSDKCPGVIAAEENPAANPSPGGGYTTNQLPGGSRLMEGFSDWLLESGTCFASTMNCQLWGTK